MAFEIVQVVMQRVGKSRRVNLVDDANKSMKLIREVRSQYQLDVADIRAIERPPINTIREYRAWREQIKQQRKALKTPTNSRRVAVPFREPSLLPASERNW
jgi:hypothetical protein